VLVPVFGPDFVSICTRPDEPSFLHLSVGNKIIQRCTDRAIAMQAQSRESSLAVSPRTPSAFVDLPVWPPKSLRPKPKKAVDEESGYGTDSDRSEKYPGSPHSCTTSGWTPVNTPTLRKLQQFSFPKAKVTSIPFQYVTSNPTSRRLNNKTKRPAKRPLPQDDNTSEEEVPCDYSWAYAPSTPKRRKVSGAMTPEMAAQTLLELNMADTTLSANKLMKRRRASA
jgi:hypothetical protein